MYEYDYRPAVLGAQNVRARIAKKVRRFPLLPLALLLACTFSLGMADTVSLSLIPQGESSVIPTPPQPVRMLDRYQITRLLQNNIKQLQEKQNFNIVDDSGRLLLVKTFVNLHLQSILFDLLESNEAAGGAIAVVDPHDGRILGLAEKNLEGEPSLLFQPLPAASIFKIITAATALEKTDLDTKSMIPYNGQKHTLYRSNLSTKITKYTHYVSLQNAFALSINPVFGKIGMYHVGGNSLSEFGEKFFFNRPLPSDLPVPASRMVVPETDFEVAEIASGYNKTTCMTPLHGAWITDTILNKGLCRSMAAVECVEDVHGNVVYSYTPSKMEQVISEETSQKLREMMRDTVLAGTARRSFQKFRTKIQNGSLDIGGKTGTINSPDNVIKYDWFVGYAVQPESKTSLAYAVVLLHKEKLGLRAHHVAAAFIERFLGL